MQERSPKFGPGRDYFPAGTHRTASAMTWPSVSLLEMVRVLEAPALNLPVAIFTQPPRSRWLTVTDSFPLAVTISTGTLVARFLAHARGLHSGRDPAGSAAVN